MPNLLFADAPRARLPSGDEYLHLLITRYNVVSGAAERAKVDGLDPAWLEHRAKLFRRFCIPSVERQTNKNFVWLILFHPRTPAHYYADLPGSPKLVFAERREDAYAQIAAVLPSATAAALSSRFDNDDAIAFDYVENIQKGIARFGEGFFRRREDFVFCLNRGLILDTAENRLYINNSPYNSFLALMEFVDTRKPWRSVNHFRHPEAPKLYPVVEIKDNEPAWMVILHERNLLNAQWLEQTPRALRTPADPNAFRSRFPGL